MPAMPISSRRRRARRTRCAVASSSTISPRTTRRPTLVKVGPLRALDATALFRVALEGELDETRDEVAVGEACVLPELRVHTHGCEAGDGVDFVEEERAVARVEEVDARQP